MDERTKDWNTYVKDWFRFADRNLNFAENYREIVPASFAFACFNCHEAAQKYLKAFLVYRTEEKPTDSEDMPELIEMCAALDDRFRELTELGNLISRYNEDVNYPYGPKVDDEDVKKALRYAAEIKAFPPLAELREKLEQEAPSE